MNEKSHRGADRENRLSHASARHRTADLVQATTAPQGSHLSKVL